MVHASWCHACAVCAGEPVRDEVHHAGAVARARPRPQWPRSAARCSSEALAAVCKNPTSPSFNHYLFEARRGARAAHPAGRPHARPPFSRPPSSPSCRQYWSRTSRNSPLTSFRSLLCWSRCGLRPSPCLHGRLPALISPTLWERSANVPALVRLLQVRCGPCAPASVPRAQS